MPRANRFYLPGYVWHITHRCHKKEFLLKFDKDKKRWMHWLFEAKKRYGLCILNYTVASNHIHLLVYEKKKETIPKSLQLIAGRTAQENNNRKNRQGAFWEDRYHATIIDSETHLVQCMVYIDFNMVRAGVVRHPAEWLFCGYQEIMNPKERYGIIDHEMLMAFFRVKNMQRLQEEYSLSVQSAVNKESWESEPDWSTGVAVGSKMFIREVKSKLGIKAEKRKTDSIEQSWVLHEPETSYN